MAKSRSTRQLWRQTESGLILPAGRLTDSTDASSETYLKIKQKALDVEKLYADSRVPLPDNCDLARLIAEAKSLSDLWLMGQKIEDPHLFNAAHLKRIAGAILPLRSLENRARYLTALTSGSLSLRDRELSTAKDVLWEIELWETLLRHGFTAELAEPPDIVISFEGTLVGIACKKFYSEKHVQNVLSKAVDQIESSFNFGIIAANLDDLWTYEDAQTYENIETAGKALEVFNERFLASHKRHFRNYLAPGRAIAALVSTDILAEIKHGRARINNASQMTVWTIPGLEAEKEKQLRRFYDQLMGKG
jgi:vacuolar-type H+-ATPase subunit F/Vma7